MAMSFVSRTTLPELTRGKTGKPSVTVHDTGQISLSSVATKAIGESEGLIVVAFDGDTRTMNVFAANPKLIKAVGGEKGCFKYKYNTKSKQGGFAASALLQDAAGGIFDGNTYDYKASGNQTFECEVNEKEKAITFKLPKGKLTKKIVVKRAKKEKTPAPTSIVPKKETENDGEDLSLDAA